VIHSFGWGATGPGEGLGKKKGRKKPGRMVGVWEKEIGKKTFKRFKIFKPPAISTFNQR